MKNNKPVWIGIFILVVILMSNSGNKLGKKNSGELSVRSFTTESIYTNQDTTVSIAVTPGTSTYYVVDEKVPSGWTIKSASDSGDFASKSGHVFWTILSGSTQKTYTYVINPGNNVGDGLFTGTIGFQNVPEGPIGGATSLTVNAGSCLPTWSCSDWSSCSSGCTQTRTCTDSNSCGIACQADDVTCKTTESCTGGSCCTPTQAFICSNGDSYYIDSCGAPTTLREDCGTGTCSSGLCVPAACTDTTWIPDVSTICSGVSFTQTSNCGTTRTDVGTKTCTTPCTADNSCAANTCTTSTCTDSCGNSYTGTKTCTQTQTCTAAGFYECSTSKTCNSLKSEFTASAGVCCASEANCVTTTTTQTCEQQNSCEFYQECNPTKDGCKTAKWVYYVAIAFGLMFFMNMMPRG